jgi:hypothetical protein
LKYFFWINVIRIVCEILADQLHNLWARAPERGFLVSTNMCIIVLKFA